MNTGLFHFEYSEVSEFELSLLPSVKQTRLSLNTNMPEVILYTLCMC